MAIRVSEVKSSKLSDDGKEIIVASLGKYTGELELRFARECLDPLLQLLMQARATLDPSVERPVAATIERPAAASAPLPVAEAAAAPIDARSSNPEEVRFEIPKNMTVTADSSGRGLVLVIMNHRLASQTGYALAPDAAKQVAGALIKSADALQALKQSATATSPPSL